MSSIEIRPYPLPRNTVQERDDLSTGASISGRKAAVTGAAAALLFYHPSYNSLRVVRTRGNIGKAGLADKRGASRRVPFAWSAKLYGPFRLGSGD